LELGSFPEGPNPATIGGKAFITHANGGAYSKQRTIERIQSIAETVKNKELEENTGNRFLKEQGGQVLARELAQREK